MSKRKKQLQSEKCYLLDCEMRPVTKSDKWCKRKMPKGQIPKGEAPWGYVVTIPYTPNQNTMLENVDGHIIRSKKHCGKLLLQIIKKDYAPQYGVASFIRKQSTSKKEKRKNKKKVYRIINIRNFRKSQGEW